jgi:hypothetical protein
MRGTSSASRWKTFLSRNPPRMSDSQRRRRDKRSCRFVVCANIFNIKVDARACSALPLQREERALVEELAAIDQVLQTAVADGEADSRARSISRVAADELERQQLQERQLELKQQHDYIKQQEEELAQVRQSQNVTTATHSADTRRRSANSRR